MLKKLFATTALAAVLATGAWAQTATDPVEAPAVEPAAPLAGAAPADPAAVETWTMVEDSAVSADTLIGADIQTPDEETIAKVNDVLMTPEGTVENVVAQFGGFLGFGTETVLLTLDEIEVYKSDSDRIVIRTSLTPDMLEGRPAYEG